MQAPVGDRFDVHQELPPWPWLVRRGLRRLCFPSPELGEAKEADAHAAHGDNCFEEDGQVRRAILLEPSYMKCWLRELRRQGAFCVRKKPFYYWRSHAAVPWPVALICQS